MLELIHRYHTHIRTPDGLLYIARTVANNTDDGRWEAWLEFEPVDQDAPTLTTDRETSQSTRRAVEVWASGLEDTYLEGAFARAHLLTARR